VRSQPSHLLQVALCWPQCYALALCCRSTLSQLGTVMTLGRTRYMVCSLSGCARLTWEEVRATESAGVLPADIKAELKAELRELRHAMPTAGAARAPASPVAATPPQQQRGLACQARLATAAPRAVSAAATGAAGRSMPGAAASSQVVSPAAAATPHMRMLRLLHTQQEKVLAAEAASAEVAAKLATMNAAAAEERAKLFAQQKLVLAALESHAQIGQAGPVEASCVPMSQLARSAAMVAGAASRRRLDGAIFVSASAPQRVVQQAVADIGQAAAATTAAGGRPFPTLGMIGSMAKLWTLYTVGDMSRGQVALRVLEASGTDWRKGAAKKSWRSRWHEIMVLINAIRARTEALGLSAGSELVAAKDIDAKERVEGGKTISHDALVRKLKAAKEAAGGAVDAEGGVMGT